MNSGMRSVPDLKTTKLNHQNVFKGPQPNISSNQKYISQ